MEHPTRAEPGRPAPIRLPRPERPAVSVLIPAYRQVAALERCLRALAGLAREAHLFETVLVLNGASRAVVELVDRGVSGATVLRSAANLDKIPQAGTLFTFRVYD